LIKKIKTHKKDPGRQNRKRPAEAAGSFTQVAHDGGNAVNYNVTQPFAKNSKANDKVFPVLVITSGESPSSILSSESDILQYSIWR
jgi:hypothetical protein